jgi:hypothetical protein
LRKHSSKKKSRFKTKAQGARSKPRTVYMKPEDMIVYIRRAEKEALPTIKELEVSAGAAIFLVAQYAQVFISGKPHLTLESATSITNSVIALWQSGSYQPGPEYPFSLEETLLDLKNGMSSQKDYSASFQPFRPSQTSAPVGLGQIAGGIVQHPKTHLWQIWIMLDGPCEFLGAYRDPSTAQKNLEDVVNAVRQRKKPETALLLYQALMSMSESEPQQIPFDMMNYLMENVHQYSILL